MSPLFRLALAAAAGYIANRKAASYEVTTTGDGDTAPVKVQRFNQRGRFFIGLGVALFAYWAIPEVVGSGSRATRLSGTARRLLAARPEPDDEEDCGCDA